MASSFRRAPKTSIRESPGTTFRSVKSVAGLRGTKAWTGGITLTSTGLRDLDQILGGGQPLGTCLMIQEDRWTRNLALCLLKYWCAEAASHDQHLLIPLPSHSESLTPPGEDFYQEDSLQADSTGSMRSEVTSLLESLPRNLHWDKKTNEAEGKDDSLAILEEGENEGAGDDELKIAWQYRKSVQRERLGHNAASGVQATNASSQVFCHSYDLNSRMEEQCSVLEKSSIHMIEMKCCHEAHCPQNRQCGLRLYSRLLASLQDLLGGEEEEESPSRRVVRLFLYHIPTRPLSVALPLLLTQIRTHKWPVVILVAVQSWRCSSESLRHLISLQRSSDVLLETEGFASRLQYPPPAEFHQLHGLLKIRKVSAVTAATANGAGHFADLTNTKRPPSYVYGLKRDRRKLNISLLHIPPEDYAQGGGSVGAGVRSGAGRPTQQGAASVLGCSSSGGGGSLDF